MIALNSNSKLNKIDVSIVSIAKHYSLLSADPMQ